jgi:hypothetical protein
MNRPTLKYVTFLQKYKEKQFFCGHTVLTEGVFVTQLPSNVGISVSQIMLVMTDCCFGSVIMKHNAILIYDTSLRQVIYTLARSLMYV